MTRKRRKPRKATLDDVVRELKQTQHCMAVLIAQTAKMQSGRLWFLIDALTPLGLRTRAVAKALGTSESAVNVTRSRRVRHETKSRSRVPECVSLAAVTEQRRQG